MLKQIFTIVYLTKEKYRFAHVDHRVRSNGTSMYHDGDIPLVFTSYHDCRHQCN